MPLQIWTGAKDFATRHERRALTKLVREMVTRFKDGEQPYALFVEFSVRGARIDLLALTADAIIILDLKEVAQPGGILYGTENGPWAIEYPEGGTHELNQGRKNPYQQLDGYRDALTTWLDQEGDSIFGPQRKQQLNLRNVAAWLAIVPSYDEEGSFAHLPMLPPSIRRWFEVMSFERLGDELYAAVTPGIQLDEADIRRIAMRLGLHERTRFDDLVLTSELALPQPRIFSPPYHPRLHVDREAELDQLMAALEDPHYGVLALGGPEGIGKKHLAGVLSERLASRRKFYWIYCADHPAVTVETLLLALANELLDRRLAQIAADPDEPVSTRMDIILDYLDRQRACLVLADYHRLAAPENIERFIRRLDRQDRQAKILLTSAQRPAFAGDLLDPVQGYWELPVRGLSIEHTLEYMRRQPAHLRLRIADEDARVIWQKTGEGYPKVLDMLARLAVGRSPAEVAAEMAVYSDEQAAGWLQSLLKLARDPARRLAEAASVLRGPIAPAMLPALGTGGDIQALANELVENYIFYWDEDEGSYTQNILLRDYLYARLNPTTRHKYHERAARHLFAAAETRPAGHERIAIQAEALYHAHAAGSWHIVLERAPAAVEQLNRWGEWPQASAIAAWALEAAEAQHKEADTVAWLLELARQARHMRDLEQAAGYCARGLALAEKAQVPALRGRAYHQMGMLASEQRNWPEARRWHLQALALERELGNVAHIARSLGKLGDIARGEDDLAAALNYYQESAELSAEAHDDTALAITYIQMGTLSKYAGDLDQAARHLSAGLHYAEQAYRPLSIAIALSQLAEVAARSGAYAPALQQIDQSLDLLRSLPTTRSHAISLGIRADILIAAGRLDEAEQTLGELARLGAGSQDAIGEAFNQKRRGLIAIRRGDRSEGSRQVQAAISRFEADGLKHYAEDCRQALTKALAPAAEAGRPADQP